MYTTMNAKCTCKFKKMYTTNAFKCDINVVNFECKPHKMYKNVSIKRRNAYKCILKNTNVCKCIRMCLSQKPHAYVAKTTRVPKTALVHDLVRF